MEVCVALGHCRRNIVVSLTTTTQGITVIYFEKSVIQRFHSLSLCLVYCSSRRGCPRVQKVRMGFLLAIEVLRLTIF
jgi:hypothetical protein